MNKIDARSVVTDEELARDYAAYRAHELGLELRRERRFAELCGVSVPVPAPAPAAPAPKAAAEPTKGELLLATLSAMADPATSEGVRASLRAVASRLAGELAQRPRPRRATEPAPIRGPAVPFRGIERPAG